jgi:hypothetical protein
MKAAKAAVVKKMAGPIPASPSRPLTSAKVVVATATASWFIPYSAAIPAESKIVLRATTFFPMDPGFSRSPPASFATTVIVVFPIFVLLLVDGLLTQREWQ